MITAHDLLVEHPFMAGVPDRFLERMAHYSHRVTVRAGTRLFSEGGRADKFWLIRDGLVSLDTRLPGRGDVVVETIGAGQVVGWSWLFPPYRWHFGATADTPVLAICFEAAGVRAMCADEPELGYELTRRLIEVVVARMQATRLRMLDLYRETTPTR
ncbi:cyclic nucleotide-binding domain-containing protein [Dactylosporangium maewongense]|uniref:Cyclic nucleotide-binding domain-containing protein n=1 Tax=Dactylosporangium maewongense TaxID=634393 RepID=A0ABN2B8E5_9ACTN